MMKKWKIALGACGPEIMYSNVIKAPTKEEAVRIYMEAEKEAEPEHRKLMEFIKEIQVKDHQYMLDHGQITQEQFDAFLAEWDEPAEPTDPEEKRLAEEAKYQQLLKQTFEHIPKPRKKKAVTES